MNLSVRSPVFALCAVAALGGCSAPTVSLKEGMRAPDLARATLQYEKADPRLGQLPTVYTCGGREVGVGYAGTLARVTLGAEQAHLTPAPSASGTRYQLPGDPGTWLWFKGTDPVLSWRGQPLGECRVVKPLVSPFMANGHEPSWRLVADAGAITLHWPQPGGRADELEGVKVSPQRPLAVGQPVVMGVGSGATEVTVFHRVCKDRINGLPKPFTAVVRKDGQTFTGCGGDTLSMLQHRTWRLTDSPATVQFEPDGRLTGSTGCNVFHGRYRMQGEFLKLDALVTTRKACLGDAMAVEQAFLRWLPKVSRHDLADDGSLTLLTADGDAHTAR